MADGELDIDRLSGNLAGLQSKKRDFILSSLKPENKQKLESSLSSLESLKNLKEEGSLLGDLPGIGKGYGKLADSWMHIGNKDKIISRDINTLERMLKPKPSLKLKPEIDLKAATAMRHKPSGSFSGEESDLSSMEAELARLESQLTPEEKQQLDLQEMESELALLESQLTPEERQQLDSLESQG